MPLPSIVQQAIEQAYVAIQTQPDHRLNPFYRYVLYTAYGSMSEPIGWRTRTWLEIYTVQRVLPLRKDYWPDDKVVDQLLIAAEAVLQGALDRKTATNQAK